MSDVPAQSRHLSDTADDVLRHQEYLALLEALTELSEAAREFSTAAKYKVALAVEERFVDALEEAETLVGSLTPTASSDETQQPSADREGGE